MTWGPINLPMPADAAPNPGVDWNAAWDNHQLVYREDWLDRLNPDHTWGSSNPAEQGGSGIAFGRAYDHMPSTLTQIKAMANSVKPDNEHAPREFTDLFEWWERTHDPKAARKINTVVSGRIAAWTPTGIPFLDYLMPLANHQGIPVNGREFGWLMWGKAMLHKVTRTSRVWSVKALDVCERAAIPGTGQVIVDTHVGIDQTGIFYCFHHTILAMGALALSHQLGKPAPKWVLDYALSLHEQPAYGLSAWPSPPSFMYSKGIRLKTATGSAQQPDPGAGYWSSLCVALAKVTGDGEWINRAYRFGCGVSQNDAQERRDSLLLRGWVSS